jgi:hypothetical protein
MKVVEDLLGELGRDLRHRRQLHTDDSRTRRAEPSVLSRLVRIVGPMPGIVSSTDWIVRFVRSFL